MTAPTDHHTAASLVELLSNTESGAFSARRHATGFEAASFASLRIEAWTALEEAIIAIATKAFSAALDPGESRLVAEAASSIGSRAVVTRAASRNKFVGPLLEGAQRRIREQIATAVPRLKVEDAREWCESLVRRCYQEVDHLREQIKSSFEENFTLARTQERLESEIRQSVVGLTVAVAALRRIEGDALLEPAAIEKEIDASRAEALSQEQGIRILCQEERPIFRLFRGGPTRGTLIMAVATSIPALGNERVAQMYLPLVVLAQPTVARTARDLAERWERRRRAVGVVRETLEARRAQAAKIQSARARVRAVGRPSDTACAAAVEEIVSIVYPTIERELRDLIAFRAPEPELLVQVLGLVRARVEAAVPRPSLDEVLFKDRDPREVAIALDREIQGQVLPLALVPGAACSRLRDQVTRIVRVAPGSRAAEALVRFAGYDPSVFVHSGAQDRLEVLTWQSGISLRETRAFEGGIEAWAAEKADPAAPPLDAISPTTFGDPSARPQPPAPPSQPARAKRSAATAREASGQGQGDPLMNVPSVGTREPTSDN